MEADALHAHEDESQERPAPTRHPAPVFKGRGAVGNPLGRFHALRREADDTDPVDAPAAAALDATPEAEAEGPPAPATRIFWAPARSALTRNQSPDIPFDRSLNPYLGCEHGCIYCFARPTHEYWGWSAGLDFETQLVAKEGFSERLRAELARPAYQPAPIALGTATDPYQPLERRLKLTRSVLTLLAESRHPVTITTKSALVLRDLDLLQDLAADGLVGVHLSLATLDPLLARRMDPRAPSPQRRLEVVQRLSDAGIPVAVAMSPIIPALTDVDIERVVEAAANAGAWRVSHILLRLPGAVAGLFEEWLRAHYPERADRVLSLLSQMRGGRLYDPRFGERMRGRGPLAALIDQRFQQAARRSRLGEGRSGPTLSVEHFRRPNRAAAASVVVLAGAKSERPPDAQDSEAPLQASLF